MSALVEKAKDRFPHDKAHILIQILINIITSICLSSSFSRLGYLSRRVNGFDRFVVNVIEPGGGGMVHIITSICLSSSFSRLGYLSRRVNSFDRFVVNVIEPRGEGAHTSYHYLYMSLELFQQTRVFI